MQTDRQTGKENANTYLWIQSPSSALFCLLTPKLNEYWIIFARGIPLYVVVRVRTWYYSGVYVPLTFVSSMVFTARFGQGRRQRKENWSSVSDIRFKGGSRDAQVLVRAKHWTSRKKIHPSESHVVVCICTLVKTC